VPLCTKCNGNFPSSITIDGKRRNLSNRKYCLECSPFGEHNTKRLDVDEAKGDRECTCTVCGKLYIHRPGSGTGPTICWSCRTKQRRIKLKNQAVEYKGSRCLLCGYSKCIDALVFHHIVPEEKEFGIANKYCLSWESLKKEIDKCALLCANCHSEVHAGIAQI
jgi:hypothetical protein